MSAVDVKEFETITGYFFHNRDYLEEALTHPSMTRKVAAEGGSLRNYERLEFLGDSVLGLVIAEILMDRYPKSREGDLAKWQAGLVRGETLVRIARRIEIGRFLRVTSGEEAMGGRQNASNLENSVEALIGAIYSDAGLGAAKEFIKRHWGSIIDEMKEPPRDPKTVLQEWAQKKKIPVPEYKLLETAGPAHSPDFVVEVFVEGQESTKASGKTKKMAEKKAAKELLDRLGITFQMAENTV